MCTKPSHLLYFVSVDSPPRAAGRGEVAQQGSRQKSSGGGRSYVRISNKTRSPVDRRGVGWQFGAAIEAAAGDPEKVAG